MSNPVPIVNLPSLYINDIKITNHATTPNTLLNVGSGICRDQSNTYDLNIGNAGNIHPALPADATTVINSAVRGINGIDTGTVAANRVYYVYVISDPVSANTTGAMISLAAPSVGPLMPFGYSAYRHVGFAVTDLASSFLLAYISGNSNDRTFMFDAPQATAVTAGNATSYTDVVLTTLSPAIENTPVWIASALTPSAASQTLKMQPVNATGDAITITGQVAAVIVTSNSLLMSKLETGAPKIAYKVSNAGAAAALNVAGFEFYI